MRKKFKFRKPRKIEVTLLVLMIFALFLLDVNQNKIQDTQDVNTLVHITDQLLIKASILFYIGLIIVFIILTFLVSLAIINKKGSALRDYIFGTIGYLGLIFIYGLALIGFYNPPTFQVPFFGTTISQITGYHFLGIALVILSSLYFSATE